MVDRVIDKRIIEQFNQRAPFDWYKGRLLVLAQIGSHSHGTYCKPENPNSIDDVDYMGIIIPPIQFELGLTKWEGCNFQYEELDCVFYSFRKFVGLLMKSNPNVLGMLWLNPAHYIEEDYLWMVLRRERDLFSSKLAYDSFIGYASGKLKEMTDPNRKFQGYMGDKRRAIVEKYGYDCKNASHLIRLMRMCVEFLDTKEINVFRADDADELIAIKTGQWTLDEVQAEANRLLALAEEKRATSTLRDHPNAEKVNDLMIDTYLAAWGLHYYDNDDSDIY
jgi:uncharacterized protein